MITDNELIRLLELADPARVADPAPVLEPAEYRVALLTGRTPVRLVDLEPTPSLNTPTGESRNRRRLLMAAAAVVVVIGVAGIALVNNGADDDQSPSVTAVPSVAPTTVPPPRVTVDSVTFTVPDGWEDNGWGVIKGDPALERPASWAKPAAAVIIVWSSTPNDDVYTRFCPSGLLDPPVGPTVDDLVAAWANLPGVDATAAVDVTVDGYAGKQIEFTVPDYNEEDCNGMFHRCAFKSNANVGESRQAIKCDSIVQHNGSGGSGSYQVLPNQHQKLWILDVDGARLMIMAGSFPDTSQQDRAALDEVLASIQIG